MSRRPVASVIGSHGASDEAVAAAEALGTALVDAGFRIVCGGRGGVMAAVCRGAHASAAYAEGTTVGILPGDDAAAANAWVDVALPTGMGQARNLLVVLGGDVVVAVQGAAGTLSEIALAWVHDKPLVALDVGGWASKVGGTRLDDRDRPPIARATTAAEAVAEAKRLLGQG